MEYVGQNEENLVPLLQWSRLDPVAPRKEKKEMCQIAIDIPNEVLFDTRMSKQEAN